MIKIEALNWKPKWTSHLGCLQGCLEHLGIEVSDDWLYGASGHGFIINIHEELCPSGPTAWNTARMMKLCQNAGCRLEVVAGHKSENDFQDKQEAAWNLARQALDQDIPCYAWELEVPEFYVVYGYDESGYHFRGPLCDSGKGPLPWRKLGDTGIGVLEFVIVRSGAPPPCEQTVKEALDFAVEHSTSPRKWVAPQYRAGLPGWDLWIQAMRDNKADAFGTAYNAAVWAECRRHAAGFLSETQRKLNGDLADLLEEASSHYRKVARHLHDVEEAFPFLDIPDDQKEAHMADARRRRAATEALLTAREHEEKGLQTLTGLANQL